MRPPRDAPANLVQKRIRNSQDTTYTTLHSLVYIYTSLANFDSYAHTWLQAQLDLRSERERNAILEVDVTSLSAVVASLKEQVRPKIALGRML